MHAGGSREILLLRLGDPPTYAITITTRGGDLPFKLDPDDMAAVSERLGPLLDLLRETMLDVDTPSMFLFADDRPRLVSARTQALDVLDQWAAEEPARVANMYARLPDLTQRNSVTESLLEGVTSEDCVEPLIALLDSASPHSRVFLAAPELVPLLDESGLVSVGGLDARPWGLHTGNYAFHYHQLLRRGFGSGIHYQLIGKILSLAEKDTIAARLALDERRVRYRDEYQETIEKDYWYGRALSEEDLDDLLAVGETFHGDPDGGGSWLHPYAGLSVRWTVDGVLKTVEIEEFMPPPKPGAEWVLARYLHAIRDTSRRAFIHCDGAVKAFAASAYPRTQQDFRTRGKGDRYRKVFRIDGEFPATVWSELACSWFRGNRLILEYFNEGPSRDSG